MTPRHSEPEGPGPEEPVVVRDRRRVDPQTGEFREPAAEPAAPGAEAAAEEEPVVHAGPSLGDSVDDAVSTASDVEKQLAERTADLQRLQAEYANYRKRVDRDRESVVQGAKASVVGDLLPLVDDLERAEQHGDLTGAFKAVGDKLVSGLQRAGLEAFGVEGEPFDPSVHEAVQHNTSPDVAGPTVTVVMRRGYRFGDRVLRAALVGVTDHEPAAAGEVPAEDTGSVGGELPLDGSIDEPEQQ
ncbi:nucleotide exchange factor GrpE [Amycolatopsis jiangsuensis]|uniref:Protein GrpE n=1 Tax=Amycolatopsis jiangsuensis TaxID=1181879 RepID=A0A840J1X3_9PSEU|nr:nucleotide exchange factor GrpE [Amycolatopsis jiangsuensis]MBB4687422.1 molecular chaperone GrpE [Amycolatopsis jiangsuensis]